ncbi:hypothetical protein [Nonomuraea cavernae]|uniref:Uncharacterized protein n=1 Tax=Nonomuraea cavernae TaxID=2045107 RepID=A0A917YV11_9ACTN|nr:hypothetical protein [Nonomuraea cavernae]MCA2185550.1 hypothetical protein [Nonomuraea cavernae]GGO66808.1 hypothetical protein GCM10012289_21710 [Nonomuraea cavernae]
MVAAGNEGTLAPPGLSNIRHPGAARRVIPARVTVLIEHVIPATAIPDAGDLPRATGDVLSGIVADLERLGAADVEPRVLATVVSARLTRSRIDRIAGRADVRRVQLSRPHRVVT